MARLVKNGGVTNATTSNKIIDMKMKIDKDGDYKIRKRRFIKIRIK